jgi:hypothetical protein
MHPPICVTCSRRFELKCDGTRWCTGGKWRENWRMEWVTSTLHTTSEHGVSNITTITTADAHISAASSRLNLRPRRFKLTRPFRQKTKYSFCACAITFQKQSTEGRGVPLCMHISHTNIQRYLVYKTPQLNHLKPSGYFIYYRALTFCNSVFCPHNVLWCLVWISEQTATVSLDSINRLGFTTETLCVYCALRNWNYKYNDLDSNQGLSMTGQRLTAIKDEN